MSHTHPAAASSSSSSDFQLIINNALDTYKKRTKKDLRTHPLGVQLEACDSPNAILTVLQEQLQGLDQSRSTDERWTKWLDPTINVLYTFSNILGTGVSLVCLTMCTCLRSAPLYLCGRSSHPRALFLPESALSFQCVYPCKLRAGHCNTWISQAAKDLRASQDTLVEIFERIGMSLRRLEVYTELRPTKEMIDMIILVIVEVLSILGIVMKEIAQGRISKCLLYKYVAVD